MIVSFHWDLREHLHELRKDDKNPKLRRDARLYILTYLAMRANIRLRCWPSTKSICKETGYSQPMVVEARNWLIAHKAIVAVPFGKRVGDEEKLPVRQTVYQLTGILDLACGVVPYLAMSPDMITSVIAELEAIGGEVVAIKTSLAKTLVAKPKGMESAQGIEEKDSMPDGKVITLDEDKTPTPPTTPAAKRRVTKVTPWYDALVEVFGVPYENLTPTAKKTYGTAAAELYSIKFPIQRMGELYRWCEAQKWSNFTPMALAKHAPQWLKAHPARKDSDYIPVEERTSALHGVKLVS